jgi:hypothetical protein
MRGGLFTSKKLGFIYNASRAYIKGNVRFSNFDRNGFKSYTAVPFIFDR